MTEIAHQQCGFDEIGDAIRQSGRIVIASHVRPDGDAVGSALALGLSLREAGCDTTIVNEDGLPSTLAFLPGSEAMLRADAAEGEFDLAIALDTANRARLGGHVIERMETADRWVNIDHHISNEGYGDLVHVDAQSPATGQIVFEFLRDQGFPLTDAARDSVFVAISTDTGSFQYPSTTARSYEIGAELIRAGANVGELSSKTYDNYPYRRIELLRELLNVLERSSEGRVASWVMTMEMKEKLHTHPEDSENLIDMLRGIEGVVVAVFFEELRDGTMRISMRSKSEAADVCKICSKFGGGGHHLAAGARVDGPLDEVRKAVLNAIHEVLEHGEH